MTSPRSSGLTPSSLRLQVIVAGEVGSPKARSYRPRSTPSAVILTLSAWVLTYSVSDSSVDHPDTVSFCTETVT
jgi:hypothetical protein